MRYTKEHLTYGKARSLTFALVPASVFDQHDREKKEEEGVTFIHTTPGHEGSLTSEHSPGEYQRAINK